MIERAHADDQYPETGDRFLTRVWSQYRKRPTTVEWLSKSEAIEQARAVMNGTPFIDPSTIRRVDVVTLRRDDHTETIEGSWWRTVGWRHCIHEDEQVQPFPRRIADPFTDDDDPTETMPPDGHWAGENPGVPFPPDSVPVIKRRS